ncbi:hypothetical protein SFRURICE_003499 [Spodoptera frugiperda]|nr:hypothetical protein SFRURICE_003499 [Spodoptera frugiperda]
MDLPMLAKYPDLKTELLDARTNSSTPLSTPAPSIAYSLVNLTINTSDEESNSEDANIIPDSIVREISNSIYENDSSLSAILSLPATPITPTRSRKPPTVKAKIRKDAKKFQPTYYWRSRPTYIQLNKPARRHIEGHWVLGLIEDGSEDLRLEVFLNNLRSAEVLVPLIQKHVVKGTNLHTDFLGGLMIVWSWKRRMYSVRSNILELANAVDAREKA